MRSPRSWSVVQSAGGQEAFDLRPVDLDAKTGPCVPKARHLLHVRRAEGQLTHQAVALTDPDGALVVELGRVRVEARGPAGRPCAAHGPAAREVGLTSPRGLDAAVVVVRAEHLEGRVRDLGSGERVVDGLDPVARRQRELGDALAVPFDPGAATLMADHEATLAADHVEVMGRLPFFGQRWPTAPGQRAELYVVGRPVGADDGQAGSGVLLRAIPLEAQAHGSLTSRWARRSVAQQHGLVLVVAALHEHAEVGEHRHCLPSSGHAPRGQHAGSLRWSDDAHGAR